MDKSKKQTHKLNPEIKKQADKLFKLLEEEADNLHFDTLTEAMSEQLGDYLRGSKGLDILEFSRLLSKTQSEKAENDLEESTWYMKDKTLFELSEVFHYMQDVLEIIESDDPKPHMLYHRMKHLKAKVPEIAKCLNFEVLYRMKRYGNEIKDLKSAS